MDLKASRGIRLLTGLFTYACIVAATLAVVDAICIHWNLFPLDHDYGDAVLGWRPAPATGSMVTDKCEELSSGETFRYLRNEDGVRTGLSRSQVLADTSSVTIGVTGDSQTDLCAPNDLLHSGVLGTTLAADGVRAIVLSYGAGRYSPLQAYLAFRTVLRPYHPQVLVLNVYTGNDLYDILRTDDRPHLTYSQAGYAIAPPEWYSLDNPTSGSRSRVLFALRKVGDKSGLRQLYLRFIELNRLGSQQGGGPLDVLSYMRDLLRARQPALGYPDAFSAQMLNQQLFFQHFPKAEEESIRRMRALMSLIKAENPGIVLVMSPLPSYELVGELPVDSLLLQTLERLPITYSGGQQQEQMLYERLRALASDMGWIFVDNLAALRRYRGMERLYNNFDYHLLPTASAIIGRSQADAVEGVLRSLSQRPSAVSIAPE